MIERWKLHVAKTALRERLPLRRQARQLKRRLRGYEPDPSNIGSTLEDLARLAAVMGRRGLRFHGTVLEIGAGWFPLAGILVRTLGAERVLLADIEPHMDATTFRAARATALSRTDRIAELFGIAADSVRQLLATAESPSDIGLEYRAPFDLSAIPNGSVDIVMSRACLEHIPVPDLRRLMADLRPKLAPDGIMAHAIDHGDHLAYADRSINRLHFLTWSEARHKIVWRLMKGGENGLRDGEFARLFADAGYEVLASEGEVHEPTLRGIGRLQFRPPYDGMAPEELATLTSWFVLRPSGARGEPAP